MNAVIQTLSEAIEAERQRQESYVELIASENYASPQVLAIQGSCLTNKYADGYPGNRTYSGCEYVDVAETLAIDRACELFAVEYANVQPYSGTQANAAVLTALLEPGDTLLGLAAGHGGHITHGHPVSFSGKFYNAVHFTTDASGIVDYDELRALAVRHRPRVILAGFSFYSRTFDWAAFRAVADEVGAWLVADIAHAAGLVAAGVCPSPVPFADVCTSTTHKTLRGPRGGLILARDAALLGERLNAGLYPGVQGGPLMHVVAAKALAFEEALRPEFRQYQQRVVDNAARLATALQRRGYSIVTGGTENHMLLLDLTRQEIDATIAEQNLEAAHITVNGLPLPRQDAANEPARGLRLGTPAVTTRGFTEAQMEELADMIAAVLDEGESACERVASRAREMCSAFPVYGPGSTWEA